MSEHSCPECGREFHWGRDADSVIPERNGQPTCGENAHWKLRFHMQEEHPEAGFACPRRGESWMGRDSKDRDWWGKRDGHSTCSYCGSMSEAEFFSAVEAGATVGPTDKNYKAYVDLPHPLAGQPCVVSSANFKPDGDGWIEITDESRKTLPLDDYQRETFENATWVQVTTRGPSAHAKFYFQHLSEEGRTRFIDLVNTKKMKIGMPGYFYARPFFARAA